MATDRTPMGSPISSILAEIFVQEIECKYYPDMIKNRHIKFNARYVDDILIVFDEAYTTAEFILEDHNMHQKLKYKMEIEANQQIIFLDLNIYRERNTFNLGIYKKPTYTDTVIPKSFNHPNNHKQAAFNYLLDRLQKIPITKAEKEK
jgi:hypothetical protein